MENRIDIYLFPVQMFEEKKLLFQWQFSNLTKECNFEVHKVSFFVPFSLSLSLSLSLPPTLCKDRGEARIGRMICAIYNYFQV